MWRFYLKIDDDAGPHVAAFCSCDGPDEYLWRLESVSYNSLMSIPASALLQREMVSVFEPVREQTKENLEFWTDNTLMLQGFQRAFSFEIKLFDKFFYIVGIEVWMCFASFTRAGCCQPYP